MLIGACKPMACLIHTFRLYKDNVDTIRRISGNLGMTLQSYRDVKWRINAQVSLGAHHHSEPQSQPPSSRAWTVIPQADPSVALTQHQQPTLRLSTDIYRGRPLTPPLPLLPHTHTCLQIASRTLRQQTEPTVLMKLETLDVNSGESVPLPETPQRSAALCTST